MTPPINIDGSKVTGITIDGTDVSEVTVDGQTVFAPNAIPDKFIGWITPVAGTTLLVSVETLAAAHN